MTCQWSESAEVSESLMSDDLGLEKGTRVPGDCGPEWDTRVGDVAWDGRLLRVGLAARAGRAIPRQDREFHRMHVLTAGARRWRSTWIGTWPHLVDIPEPEPESPSRHQ